MNMLIFHQNAQRIARERRFTGATCFFGLCTKKAGSFHHGDRSFCSDEHKQAFVAQLGVSMAAKHHPRHD